MDKNIISLNRMKLRNLSFRFDLNQNIIFPNPINILLISGYKSSVPLNSVIVAESLKCLSISE